VQSVKSTVCVKTAAGSRGGVYDRFEDRKEKNCQKQHGAADLPLDAADFSDSMHGKDAIFVLV